jgi:hypothetical protein
MSKYSHLRLFTDIFYVNGNLFLHTISEFIKFRTVAPLNNRAKQTILTAIMSVLRLYDRRGFTVTRVEADHEFAPLIHDLLPTQCNIAAADDHVAEVERSIRTVKERVRSLLQGLPFKRVPKLVIRAAVAQAHTSLNQFPNANSASSTISPLTIMTGSPLPNYHDLRIEFGSYAQIFEANDPTNTMDTRTTGAIALNPTGNTQGGVYFLSLSTGRRLTRQQWTPLPMPNGVIARVEEFAIAEHQPIMAQGAANFEWAPGVPINEDNSMVMDLDPLADAALPQPADYEPEQNDINADDQEEDCEDHDYVPESSSDTSEDEDGNDYEPESDSDTSEDEYALENNDNSDSNDQSQEANALDHTDPDIPLSGDDLAPIPQGNTDTDTPDGTQENATHT